MMVFSLVLLALVLAFLMMHRPRRRKRARSFAYNVGPSRTKRGG